MATSLSHAVAAAVGSALGESGVRVVHSDLYAEGFQPLLTESELKRRISFDPLVQRAVSELRAADLLVCAHPDWWGQPPAMLKGWLDRLFRPGVAYDYRGPEFAGKQHVPLLVGRGALICCTTDQSYAEKEGAALVIDPLWRNICAFCGIAPVRVHILYEARATHRRRQQQWFQEAADMAHELIGLENGTD